MGYPTKKLKELISLYLSKIENEKFRFSLFFVLGSRQYFLFNVYDSHKGFLPDYKGMQLSNIYAIDKLTGNESESEFTGKAVGEHMFLYDGFGEDSSIYIKKIRVYGQEIAICEFLARDITVIESTKSIIEKLINESLPYLVEVFMSIRNDTARRYFSMNALNIIKSARPRTFYHSFRVADLAVAIAKKMGLDKESQRKLYYAGLIHDIGEMYIPRDVFYKEGKLSKEELEIIKQHPKNLKRIFEHNPLMGDIVEIAYYHHERVDGKGYYGYTGDNIPLESKILALCEVVDGLYSDRPDRKGFGVKKIISLIEKSYDVFGEDIVRNSIEAIDKFYSRKELDVSILDNINSVGKPATIIASKNGKLIFLQGSVEYANNKMLGVSFNDDVDIEFSYREIIRVQFPFFDFIYDFKAAVISSSSSSISLVIKGPSETSVSNLSVLWEFDAIAIPLRFSPKSADSKKESVVFVKIRVERFGSKSLSARVEKSNVRLTVGETVLLKMKPLKDTITIPAVVSNIMDRHEYELVYFEYFNISEKTDALIHRAIYYKQSKQNAPL
ncbi:HD-GYP domain-containing protein [Hippea alviniae]|uniref:HD-GYP domain-containing protein n=1 Tax=Hippea alviniae TaxID=1279027 RepID=UPI0003B73101|nr:HD domain-containing phosphohydrolase [Hippea alviniae]